MSARNLGDAQSIDDNNGCSRGLRPNSQTARPHQEVATCVPTAPHITPFHSSGCVPRMTTHKTVRTAPFLTRIYEFAMYTAAQSGGAAGAFVTSSCRPVARSDACSAPPRFASHDPAHERRGVVPDAPPTEADQPQTRCTASCGTPVRSDRPVARVQRAEVQEWGPWCMIRARSTSGSPT